jgi:hypothetical protein
VLRWIALAGLLFFCVGFAMLTWTAMFSEDATNEVGFVLWWDIGVPLLLVAGIGWIIQRFRRGRQRTRAETGA